MLFTDKPDIKIIVIAKFIAFYSSKQLIKDRQIVGA